MDPRLRIHNAVIGLAHPNPPWPRSLADAGYRIARIEQPVGTRLGEVCVDLLLVAEERSAILAVECKEGTVQADQARKYDAMEPLDVVQTGGVSVPDPTAAVLDVVYAVDADRIRKTIVVLDALALSPGVLAIGPSIEWHRNPPQDPRLRAVFSKPIPADVRAIPRLLLVDDASHPSMLATELANQLHAVIEEGRDSITVDALIEERVLGLGAVRPGDEGPVPARCVGDASRRGKERVERVDQGGASGSAGRRDDPHRRAGLCGGYSGGRPTGIAGRTGEAQNFVSRVTGKPMPEALGQLTFEEYDEPSEEDDMDEEQ
jgi:hypothetical protein